MTLHNDIDWQDHKDYQSFCNTSEYKKWAANWNATDWQGEWQDFVIYEDLYSKHNPRDHLMHPDPATQTRLPYWLLDSFANNDSECVDIGCGTNLFAKYQSNITGVDPEYPDFRNYILNDAWWVDNWGKWPRVFSVNALHFVSQNDWPALIHKATGVLKSGGEAIISVNRQRIKDMEQTFTEEIMRDQISQMAYCKKVIWFQNPLDASLDGNVWMWFSKDN